MKKKKHMKRFMEDTAMYGGSQLMLGGFGVVGGSMGAPMGGLTTLASSSRAIAPLIPLKHGIGMLMDVVPKKKKDRR